MEKLRRSGFGKHGDIDMTSGNIVGILLRFSFPLLLGNLFQQLYNMVDTWVIGQTGETSAYAAVGSVGPIINILIGLFSGFSTGACVVISQHYGAKNQDKVTKSVHTAMAFTFFLGIVFTVIGVALSPWMLQLMLQREGESAVYPFARDYLVIYFSGVLGIMIYNMGSGVLRAVGDSSRPFYFLVVSAVVNTGLDLLFVFKFHMGVRGVAWATVIAQGLSAVLTVVTLFLTRSAVRMSPRALKIDPHILGRILTVGLPAALQMALTAFSNVFVQSYIAGVNGDQSSALGGWTTYSKIDQFIFLPLQSLAMAIMTFVGQNLGIGDVRRARRGTRCTFLMALIITASLIGTVELLAPQLSAVFNSDPAVVENATTLLRILSPFYLFCCVNQIFSASMRGTGDSKGPMILMLVAFVAMRQVYLFFMSRYISNDLIPIGMSYPFGWACCATLTLLYYFFVHKRHLNARLAAIKQDV